MRTGSNEQTGRRRSIAARVVAVLALAAGTLALGTDPARAAGPVDQSQPVAEWTFNVDVRSAQTFTAGATGLLDQVDVAMVRADDGGSSEPFVVELTAVSGGVPSGAPLATESVPAASVPTGPDGDTYAFVSVPLEPALPVVAGTTYAIVIERAAPWHAIYALGSPYDGGTAYVWDPYGGGVPVCGGPCWRTPLATFTNYVDMGFHTYVSPPPPAPAPPGFLSGLLDGLAQQLPVLQPVLSPVSGLLRGLGL